MSLPILVLDRHGQAALKGQVFYPECFWPGSSAWMILTHFAWSNSLTVSDMRTLLGPSNCRNPLENVPFEWNLAAPPWVFGKLRAILKLPAKVIRLASGPTPRDQHPARSVAYLRYCPACLQLGIHGIAHQWRFLQRCPVHHRMLLDACQSCGEPIEYRLNATTFCKPGHCPHCHHRLIARAWAGQPPTAASRHAATLSRFCIDLARLRTTTNQPAEIAWLARWFAVFRRAPPEPTALPDRDRQRAFTLAKLDWTLPADPNGADPAWRQADAIYRQYARLRWRQLTLPERKALMKWRLGARFPLGAQPAGVMSPAQFAFLAWRLTWEGLENPLSLFQKRWIPAVGVAVWLAFNAHPDGDDEPLPMASPLSPKEKQGLLLALAGSAHNWHQSVAFMDMCGTHLFCLGLIRIPGDCLAFG